ncbi:hypothetical protein ACIRPQ_08115 [Streptomyces sp. NPDC101213]|uniref:hypothetical protein n=1 Tax=Streptomyces sp. NPDC101213 TaxID=3366130 RepID=UPI00382338AA
MADELSAKLSELAASHATAPVVGGPATRARAMRRARRRRAAATLGAGAAALALLGLALGLHLDGDRDHPDRSGPAAVAPSRSVPPSTAVPTPVVGSTLDLYGRTLTFGGRAMRILSASEALLRATGPMTVVAKEDPKEMPLDVPREGPTIAPTTVSVRYVVELRDGEGLPHYVGLSSPQLEDLSDDDTKDGWIGLGAEDAEWFHTRARPGDTVPVTTATTSAATPSDAVQAPGATASPRAAGAHGEH